MRMAMGILLGLIAALFTGVSAADAKKADDKDPLAKFSEEDLVKIDFCFEKFCEAVAAKDAKTAAAFMDAIPKNLAKLDLTKDADKQTNTTTRNQLVLNFMLFSLNS